MKLAHPSVATLASLAGLMIGAACSCDRKPTPTPQPVPTPQAAPSPSGGSAAESEPVKQPTHDERLGKPDLVAENADADLKSSKVVGLLETPHLAGTSLVWCSTMQLAWNAMEVGLGEPVEVTPAEAASGYQSAAASTDDLDSGSYVALGGFGRDGILDAIKTQLKDKFGGAASPSMLPAVIPPDDLFAYAYLFKALEFAEPFARLPEGMRFGSAPVGGFGLWPSGLIENRSKIASQIDVRHYASPEDWTVQLTTKDAADMLVVARREPGATLAETVAAIVASMKPGDAPLRFLNEDTLRVPLMNFDVTRNYGELVGLTVVGTKGGGTIAMAKQNIRLRLDEKGAILKSEAAIGVTSAMPQPVTPKVMVCDGPFMLLLMRKDAPQPYFAAWIESPELLVKR